MTTQSAVIDGLPTGLSPTAKLFDVDAPDTEVTGNSFAITEGTNAKSRYVVTITRATVLPAGDYTLRLFLGSVPLAVADRRFAGTDGETATEIPKAVELDSATIEKIDDILTDTGTTLPGLIAGISGGGSSTVNVLPATGITADRSAGTTLKPVVGETISQAITVYQTDGTTPVDLSGKTLAIIFETMAGVDVAVVPAGSITISGDDDNVVTFAYPSAVTASERVLRFAIRDAAAPLTMYLQGYCSVVNAPKVDA
jgi:hypothetical protein